MPTINTIYIRCVTNVKDHNFFFFLKLYEQLCKKNIFYMYKDKVLILLLKQQKYFSISLTVKTQI